MIYAPSSTGKSIDVAIFDDSGIAVTGLVAATFPAVYWSLAGNTAATAITLSDLALITTAWAAGGVKERSAGRYRLDLPDAALSTAGDLAIYGESTGKHLLCEPITIQLAASTAAATASATRTELSAELTRILLALPAFAGGAAGGLQIAGANAATTYATLTSTGAFSINGVVHNAQTGDSYARLGAPIAGSISADIATRSTYAGADTAGTTTLLTRLPSALTITSGNVLANVQATAAALSFNLTGNITGNLSGSVGTLSTLPAAPADWLTAAAVKADAVTKIAAGVLNANSASYGVAGSVGEAIQETQGAAVNAAANVTTILGRVPGSVALAATALSTSIWTGAKAAFLDQSISAASTITAGTLSDISGVVGSNLVGLTGSVGTLEDLVGAVGDAVGDIQSRIPAALVSGRMDSSMGAVATGVIVTDSFAAGTAIPRVTLVDTTTTNTDMRGTNGAITDLTPATNLIDALSTAFAPLASLVEPIGEGNYRFTASSLSADGAPAVSDIINGLLNEPIIGHTTAGTVGAALIAAGNSGDPWSVTYTTLQGYNASTAAGLLLKLMVGEPADPVIVIPAAPVGDTLCRVYLNTETVRGGVPPGTEIIFTLHTAGPAKANKTLNGRTTTVTTNAAGQIETTESAAAVQWVSLQRNDTLTPSGTFWSVTCPALSLKSTHFHLTTGVFDLGSLIS